MKYFLGANRLWSFDGGVRFEGQGCELAKRIANGLLTCLAALAIGWSAQSGPAIAQAFAVAGDVNGDQTVNCADLTAVQSAMGRRTGQPGFLPAADLDG